MGFGMVIPVRADLLEWVQASVGWALLAARANRPVAPSPVIASERDGTPANAPLRLRATITIDIDASDAEEAERSSDLVRAQFELLKNTHPTAVLTFQRRKPRTTPRAPAPALVVAPYVDD